ncbi:restriction endonuclease subunit S [Corallococcus sp. BB11-1]|uniref:restriction endonuclease subunit S n=1 Tax=Corallococcus sp. BB11-1 TaxID=2996783 RepID=UPI00226FF91D|nr:restriction endonuclease subunit S [Corallococcus sp. BB11-1]MCY1035677.1 restriction endonuclease subunit S [Corallococcus sp. BB11-1]
MDKSLVHGWREIPLENCMNAIIDYRGKSPSKTDFGVPLITAKVVKGGRLLEQEQEFIAEEEYDAWMRRGLPEVGDVLITTEAPLGEVAQVNAVRIALAQRIILLRGNPALLDNTFLKFALQSVPVQREIHARATGTTVLGIRQSELRRVLLPVPPLDEQRNIAELLGSLDDKIELNLRMNRTLEAMAQALFQSWFVDFEPVRAKAEGLQPEVMDAATAALFPNRFVNSELGDIPYGWRVSSLGDFVLNRRQQVDPSRLPAETPYIGLEHMPRGSICLDTWESISKVTSAKLAFKKGQILFGRLRPYFKKVGVTLVEGVCSSDILVIEAAQRTHFGWALGHLTRNEFIDYTSNVSSGTRMPRVAWEDIARFKVAAPPTSEIPEAFDRLFQTFVARMASAARESAALSSLRESLLPKLLSGEIRIRDAESQLTASA